MNISEMLKSDIESYAAEIRSSNQLYTKTRRGELTPDAAAMYIASLRLLVSHTMPNLDLARKRASELGMMALAQFFADKALEERGHDAWAERDLEKLKAMFGLSSAPVPARAISELLEYLRSVIQEEPAQYLAYILFSEYLTVLVGGEWLGLVEERCGIPARAMTVVGNHVELDRDHVAEGSREIDALLGDETKREPLRHVLRASMRFFDGFCDEVSATIH